MKKNGKRKKRIPTRTVRAPREKETAQSPNGQEPLAIAHSDAVKAKALVSYRETGTVLHACIAAGVARRTWYDWIENDSAFANAAIEAAEGVTDDLEREAIKRAKEGSDTLIIFLLKSKRPEQYRETHKIEVVSPAVRENLRQTIAIINEELDAKTAERVLERLDKVWSDAA